MVTAGQLYSEIKNILNDSDIESSVFEARCITEEALNAKYETIIANPDKPVPEELHKAAVRMAEQRITGYPLQYILGEWEFFGIPFKVGDGVLIPRQDTETLVENVLVSAKNIKAPRIADLCSGSGCIPIAIEKYTSGADITAVEYSDAALAYLKRNIELNSSKVRAFKGNVLDDNISKLFNSLDIITSNPPYLTSDDMNSLQKEVSFEPEMALAGGDDGLLFYRAITSGWKSCLKPGGMIFYEIGISQENDVAQILKENGFTDIKTYPDLCGVIRVVSGVYNI